jgi:hypothetical protein
MVYLMSLTDHTVLCAMIGRVVTNNELDRIWKKAGLAYLLRNTTEILNQNSQDLKVGPSE